MRFWAALCWIAIIGMQVLVNITHASESVSLLASVAAAFLGAFSVIFVYEWLWEWLWNAGYAPNPFVGLPQAFKNGFRHQPGCHFEREKQREMA